MKRIILTAIGLAILSCPLSYGQVTVEQCQQMARENYPLVKQYGLIEKSKNYTIANANKGYLPQLSLSAKVTYQSAVTEVPVQIPGIDIDGVRKDQYQAVLELNQTIWDGGVIRSQKQITKAEAEVSSKQTEVDLYQLNERVNQMFFGILLMDTQLEQNDLLQKELQRNYWQVAAYMENGVANQADLDAVRVEQLNAMQRESEMKAAKQAYVQMLSYMTGKQIAGKLLKPEANLQSDKANEIVNRPELFLFMAQDARLIAQRRQLQAKNLPKLGLFIQGAYGNPGLNMLKNEFTPYYMAGLRLSWNFGNLYTKKNESKLIEINRSQVNVRKETFLFNTNLEITQSSNEIDKLRELMRDDEEIIRLRTNIRQAAEAKVANGTLTVIEMLREVTAEDQAKQNKSLHEVQLLMAIYNLKNTTNN